MSSKRIISVDVVRGLTIMMMILVNHPGDWNHVYPPLKHSHWNGLTLTDLIFPFFIFIVGVTTVLSCKSRKLTLLTFQKILTRTLRLFVLGLFLNISNKIVFFESSFILSFVTKILFVGLVTTLLLANYKIKYKLIVATLIVSILFFLIFNGGTTFNDVRIMGVLQRIAIVYFFISMFYYTLKMRSNLVICVLILLGYWLLMTTVPIPGIGRSNMNPSTNLAAWLDRLVLEGHLWSQSKTWDPEGLLSTLPAIATGILGLCAGYVLKNSYNVRLFLLFIIIGTICLSLGYLLNLVFPINKALWTSSYVLVSGGWSFIIFAIFYFILEALKLDRWKTLIVSFGMNSILLYFLSEITPSILSSIRFNHNPLCI